MSRSLRDHLGRSITIPDEPRRIVCLCPSLTETLLALGLASRVVGRTRYCIHPADQVDNIPVVGGTKDVNVEAVAALAPDLAIAEREENVRDQVDAISHQCPVFVADVTDIPSALQTIEDLGNLTGCADAAATMRARAEHALAAIKPLQPPMPIAYLVWRNPYMAAGATTYVHDLLTRCGLHNVCASLPGRYPEVSIDLLREQNPRAILLSTEPFPFEQAHVDDLRESLPAADVRLVDGERCSWYGVRMIDAGPYLARLTDDLRSPR